MGFWGEAPRNPKYAENLIECHKFHSVETKKFQCGNFGGRHVPLDLPQALGLVFTYLRLVKRRGSEAHG